MLLTPVPSRPAIPAVLALLTALTCSGCCDGLFGSPNAPAPPIQSPITVPVAEPTPSGSLGLYVVIDGRGFTVGSPQTVLSDPDGGDGPTVPCKEKGCLTPDSYDYAGLTETMGKVKDEYPDEQQVIIRAAAHVEYEVIVLTLDAVRSQGDRELFGEVVLHTL